MFFMIGITDGQKDLDSFHDFIASFVTEFGGFCKFSIQPPVFPVKRSAGEGSPAPL